MFTKIKRWCWNSLTMAWAYLMALASFALAVLMLAAEALNAPEIKTSIAQALDPQTVAWIGLGVAVVTAIARLRSLGKAD
jgi:preprotein translocase subunit Sec61beta